MADPVDVNRASREELMAVHGIGEKLADRILRFRDEHGPLKNIDDLMEMPGVKEGSMKSLRELLRVGRAGKTKIKERPQDAGVEDKAASKNLKNTASTSGGKPEGRAAIQKSRQHRTTAEKRPPTSPGVKKSPDAATKRTAKSRKAPTSKPTNNGRVDLNRITQSELGRMPGIGKGMAEKIVQFRHEHAGFYSFDDLADVPTIDIQTIELLKELCVELAKPETRSSSAKKK